MSKINFATAASAAVSTIALSGCLATAPTQQNSTQSNVIKPVTVTEAASAPTAAASAPVAKTSTATINWNSEAAAKFAADKQNWAADKARAAKAATTGINGQFVTMTITSKGKNYNFAGEFNAPACGVMSTGTAQTAVNTVTSIGSSLWNRTTQVLGNIAGQQAHNAAGGGTVGRVAQQATRQETTAAANGAGRATANGATAAANSTMATASEDCKADVQRLATFISAPYDQWKKDHAGEKATVKVTTLFDLAQFPDLQKAAAALGDEASPSSAKPAVTRKRPDAAPAPRQQ